MTLPQRQIVAVRNPNDGEPLLVEMEGAATESSQAEMLKELRALNSLVPAGYNQILFEYTGDDMTKIEFIAEGKTIGIIEMNYENHRLTSLFRS